MLPSAAANPARKRNVKKLAPAFVVTVALLVAPQACGGNVDDGSGPGTSDAGTGGSGGTTSKGGSGGSGGSTNNPACPATQPVSGACSGDLTCSYPTGGGCPPQTSHCQNGKWVASFMSCNPPPPACPEGEIVEGESCPGGGFGQTTCPREVAGCKVTFRCEGKWKKTVDSCATCPAQPPAATKCGSEGQTCTYTVNTCPLTAVCKNGMWSSSGNGSCNPPPPPCPAEEPTPATACPTGGFGQTYCIFGKDQQCPREYLCQSGSWAVVSKPCDEPAKPACEAALDATSCTKDPGCRWLEPGCASPPQVALAKAGCFASAECKADSECVAGRACRSVVTDPCAGKACDACGQEQKVCQ